MLKDYPAGGIGASLSLISILLGLPLQIHAVWAAGSSEALSIAPLLLGIGSGCHYGLHGYRIGDRSIFLPQLLGVPLTMIIVIECIYFR